jgi:hypothetical protein
MKSWTVPEGLPAGRVVVPAGTRRESAPPDPVIWVSEQATPDAGEHWVRLFDERALTGLYPLLLGTHRDEPSRPWQEGELSPVPASAVAAIDVDGLLRARWTAKYPEDFFPDKPWPGPAPGGTPHGDPDHQARELAGGLAAGGQPFRREGWHLGLVPAGGGADALAVSGWQGANNHWRLEELSAIVRSWEERFAARVVAVGFNTLHLAWAAPPATREQAWPLAHELMIACPLDDYLVEDLVDGIEAPDGSLRGSIIGERHHSFSWD